MIKLSEAQRRALILTDILRKKQFSRLRANDPTCTPSEWVNYTYLLDVGIRQTTLDALVKRGAMLVRKSGGCGPEYKIPNQQTVYPS